MGKILVYVRIRRGIIWFSVDVLTEDSQTWKPTKNLEIAQVVFRYTYLREYQTFWVGLETGRVRVSRNVDPPPVPVSAAPAPKSGDRNSEFDFALVDPGVVDDDKPEESKENIPQPAQNAVVPQLSSATENKAEEEESVTPLYIPKQSTTLRTTTTTAAPPRRPLPVVNSIVQVTDPDDEIFSGCDTTKTCFGRPAGCVRTGQCEQILAFWPDKLNYQFHMKVGPALCTSLVLKGLVKQY